MNQYAVLLVDDEEEVFQVMMKKLPWEEMGFHIAGYARNGIEALEMAEELQPDVVMTDIKMSYMDGLTLCKQLKELYPGTKVIIFSGFDEFEYAKEAIKIEAEEYILKPINSVELKEVFERIKTALDKELDEKRNIEKLREYYMQSLPVLQENFYASLIEGRIPENKVGAYLSNYQIDLKGPFFAAVVLHISGDQEGQEMDPFLKLVSVKQLAEEMLSDTWKMKSLTYLGDIVLIAELPGEEAITHLTDDLDKLCKNAKRVCKASVTAGIGHACDSLDTLQVSYQGAQNAASYRVIYGNTRAINIAEIDPQENVDSHWESDYVKRILKKIKMGHREELDEVIGEFITALSKSKISLQQYRIMILELIAEIYRFGTENRISMETVFGAENDIYAQILQLESAESLGNWLRENSFKMQEQILNERMDTTKSFVSRAEDYVKEHYSDQDLSIETICSYLNVSAAYFSTIFKKETGKTFINYLTEYRMEKAVDLLLQGDQKTYIVAERVGYADSNYFSYVFKKQFGISPSKYKSSRMGDS
ncbi:MAG: response regulator [Lachnospiraceae bacterium]|nr:response regulator [Lachnospiraceae bacterium]